MQHSIDWVSVWEVSEPWSWWTSACVETHTMGIKLATTPLLHDYKRSLIMLIIKCVCLDTILKGAENCDVAFLVVGDPLRWEKERELFLAAHDSCHTLAVPPPTQICWSVLLRRGWSVGSFTMHPSWMLLAAVACSCTASEKLCQFRTGQTPGGRTVFSTGSSLI